MKTRLCKPALTAATLTAALAAALTPTGASAQGVTLYGLIDGAVERLDHVGASGGSLTRMPGLSGSAPSRLGVRGSEDLGGGLRALFTLEQGLAPDQGTFNQGGRGFGRQAYVGLAGPWGTLTLGRQYSMLFWSQLDADILGPNTFGSGSMDSYLPNARVDNSIAWRGRFGGLDLGASTSFGRDAVNAGPSPSGTNCAGESATDHQACRQWSLLAKFDSAAWGVAAAVDEMRGGPGAFAGLTSSALKDRRATVAGWARLGTVKLGAGLITRRNGASTTTPRSDLWYLGASLALTPALTLDGQVFRLDVKNSANAATLAAVRASYQLSKRSTVYATAGRMDNSGTLALSVSNGAAGASPAAGTAQTGVALGVRHTF